MDNPFQLWTERLKVYNEYIKTLGEYKLNQAKADLEHAKAEYERTKAANLRVVIRAKELLVRQLRDDLKSFNKAKKSKRNKIKRINSRIARINWLFKGRKTIKKNFRAAWNAYLEFENEVALNDPSLIENLVVPKSALGSQNFFLAEDPAAATKDAPDHIDHPLVLASWMKSCGYLPQVGSKSFFAIRKLASAINGYANEQIKSMEKRIEEMRDGIFETWQPITILGLGIESAKNIEAAKQTPR